MENKSFAARLNKLDESRQHRFLAVLYSLNESDRYIRPGDLLGILEFHMKGLTEEMENDSRT